MLDTKRKITPIEGMLRTLEATKELAIGNTLEGRDDVFNTELYEGDIIIDTCCAFDTHTWETGICKKNGHFIIVEQYNNRNEAVIGHNKWVEKMTQDKKQHLEDINVWDG